MKWLRRRLLEVRIAEFLTVISAWSGLPTFWQAYRQVLKWRKS